MDRAWASQGGCQVGPGRGKLGGRESDKARTKEIEPTVSLKSMADSRNVKWKELEAEAEKAEPADWLPAVARAFRLL
uniref:Uncharacterized protein n=1 Tax=Oryza barthii TaxID=65489 RepID=A0A0D3GG80_9ORYZ